MDLDNVFTCLNPACAAAAPEVNTYGVADAEAEFCRNFVCCGIRLRDLHELLKHHEDFHATGLDADHLAAVRARYGVEVAPDHPATPTRSLQYWTVETRQRPPVACHVLALGHTKGRPAAASPAAELVSPPPEPPVDSGYASPGSGIRTPCTADDEICGAEGLGLPKSYSAFFGRFAESLHARTAADIRVGRIGCRGSHLVGGGPPPALASSPPSVNLCLVAEKLSANHPKVASPAFPNLCYPGTAMAPPAELVVAGEDLASPANARDHRRPPPQMHSQDTEVQDEKLVKSDTPDATSARSGRLVCCPPLARTSAAAAANAPRIGGGVCDKKPWACPITVCRKRFRFAGGLKYHLENRHAAATGFPRAGSLGPPPSLLAPLPTVATVPGSHL